VTAPAVSLFGFYLVWFVRFCDRPARRVDAGTEPPDRSTIMVDKDTQEQAGQGNTIKDPERWTTGDEPMTGAQRSYLTTLAEEAGEEVDAELSKAEASKRIDALQEKTGRGK
jgi:hypothetical protein